MALFINQREQVAGYSSQEIEDVLVVTELDVIPHDVLFQVLLLLKLEDVADEELLQLFVGKINAQLLKTVKQRATCMRWNHCSCLAVTQ